MSKTQEKRARRLAEQKAFIKERRRQQLAWYEANFAAGLQMFNDNRDKMNETEITALEKEMQMNVEFIANFKKEWGLDDEEPSEQGLN